MSGNTKTIIVLPFLLAGTFLLGGLYAFLNALARDWAFYGLVNLTVVAPLVYGGVLFSALTAVLKALGCKKGPLRALTALLCGGMAVYANLFWTVQIDLDVTLWGLGDLMTGMRIVADCNEIGVLLIPFTGKGLVFAYWVEALVVFGICCGGCLEDDENEKKSADDGVAKEDGEEEDKPAKKSASGAAKAACAVALLLSAGCLLTGCSGGDKGPLPEPDPAALEKWVGAQDWKSSPTGWSKQEVTLAGRTVVVGVGCAEIPKSAKLKEANQKRVAILALRGLSRGGIKLDKGTEGVVKVMDDELERADGTKCHVVALARVKE